MANMSDCKDFWGIFVTYQRTPQKHWSMQWYQGKSTETGLQGSTKMFITFKRMFPLHCTVKCVRNFAVIYCDGHEYSKL